MKNILAGSHRRLLEELAWSNVLLAFDYDGTLAPIVADPRRARMRRRTRALLQALAKLYRVVVISGRAREDARSRLRGVGLSQVVGNHGLEPGRGSRRYAACVRCWRGELDQAVAPFRGVTVEDKVCSVAIHYRRSREKKRARAAILRAATALGDVRVIGGKQVVNILPGGAPDKGQALERERERLRCDTAIYVGDDETDEHVFTLDQPGRLLTIRVGPKRTSAAAYYIANQHAIDELLRALLQYRRRSERGPSGRA